jgi:CheY-like chemotaxis protein
MARMSGPEVAETARTLHPSLPIIVASGSATQQDLLRMRARNVSFVCKPVDLHALEEIICRVLTRVDEGRAIA